MGKDGVRFPTGAGNFLSSKPPKLTLGSTRVHTRMQYGARALSSGFKRPVKFLLPSTAQVKKIPPCTSLNFVFGELLRRTHG